MTILVVDDSRIMRNIVRNALAQTPKYERAAFLEAPDGTEAMRILEDKDVDLLLLDWNMPGLNGIDLVRRLRAQLQYKSLPIIMITSEAAKYNVIEAVKAGVNDYLIKPVSDRSLLEKIERLGRF